MKPAGRWITTLAAATLLAAGAAAAAYPERAVRLVVPFPAGGGADFMARALAQKLSAQLGQPVVLDHRAGAGGTIAAEAVAERRARRLHARVRRRWARTRSTRACTPSCATTR